MRRNILESPLPVLLPCILVAWGQGMALSNNVRHEFSTRLDTRTLGK